MGYAGYEEKPLSHPVLEDLCEILRLDLEG